MDFNDDENIEWLMESSKTVENLGETGDDFERTERESIELCRFLQVLRISFESEPILVESKAKGTIKSEDNVHKLIRNLKALGYFFSIRTSEKKMDRQSELFEDMNSDNMIRLMLLPLITLFNISRIVIF
ncbi:hypothetical protein RUM43_005261 [Polyplax serrata]|uniref:Uncharacterized protein n=1 Tax=Polyplax serrata TaxID=468196 RepID=A0AAN8S2Q2_POLSC